jgi:hypothetical protein
MGYAPRPNRGAVAVSHPADDHILSEAKRLVHGDRNEQYGPPNEDFTCAAKMISAYISRKHGVRLELTAEDLPAIMICVKLSRLAHAYKKDTACDIAGYAETLAWVKA